MKILLVGFEPFGELSSNSSERLVSSVPNHIEWKRCSDIEPVCHQVEIVKRILPVTVEGAFSSIKEAFLEHRPDVVLCVGQAGGRADISVEMLGINQCDFSIPDNSGNRLVGEPIVPNGREAFFTTIPCRKIVDTLQNRGIPASLSYSAGTYICNYTIYRVGELLAKYPEVRFGFLHIPYLPEQVAMLYRDQDKKNLPSMTLGLLVDACKILFEECL